jgi:hypothetical protein
MSQLTDDYAERLSRATTFQTAIAGRITAIEGYANANPSTLTQANVQELSCIGDKLEECYDLLCHIGTVS